MAKKKQTAELTKEQRDRVSEFVSALSDNHNINIDIASLALYLIHGAGDAYTIAEGWSSAIEPIEGS